MIANRDEFERAFVVASYLLERRGQALAAGLGEVGAQAAELVQALSHPERSHRAQALALGLSPILAALQRRKVTEWA